MMSETAFFVKDVIGPRVGVDRHGETFGRREVGRHQRPYQDQPDPLAPCRHENAGYAYRRFGRALHDDLCEREQRYLLKAIRENLDLPTI